MVLVQFIVPIKQLFGRLLERAKSGKKVPEVFQVTRAQLPIVRAFAIITYKAHRLAMNEIVVDLQVASIYVPLSRVRRAGDVVILRSSLARDVELKRLSELNRKRASECASYVFGSYINK